MDPDDTYRRVEAAAQAMLSRFELRRFAYPLTLEAIYLDMCIAVRVTMAVMHRDTGMVTTVNKQGRMPIDCVRERPEDFERFVFELVRETVLHELDECWHVDGKRVRDPHRGERGLPG